MEERENGGSTEKPLSERERQKKKQDDAMKRAAGHLPPERDEVSGKMINPHNPEFITKVPWYLGESGPTLKHHADQKSNSELSMVDADNLFARKHATQVLMKRQSQKVGYRKGACKNCGAMTHKEKDCVERPRSKKKAAVNSGLNIAHDEVVLDLKDYGKLGYSAKRDAWQGYDADEYQDNIEKYKRIEAERRRIKKEEKAARKQKEGEKKREAEEDDKRGSKERKDENDSGSEINDSDDTDDGDGESDDDDDNDETGVSKKELLAADDQQRDFQGRMARQGGVGGNQMMVTARNLRIREDKPKYLRNLDLNSAHYDPKSRSMRANPTPGVNPADLDFAGDNFHRQTGDAVELARAQVLAWEMEGHVDPGGSADSGSGGGQGGIDIIANPSAAALATKQYKQEKESVAREKQLRLADRYGDASAGRKNAASAEAESGAAKGAGLDERLRLGQTELYCEYTVDAAGRVVQKNPLGSGSGVGTSAVSKTKYEEDVLEGNHTSVWGSWYDRNTHQWGYACCWSVLRGSYCTGQAGKDALTAASSGLSRLMEEKRKGSRSTTGGAEVGLDESKTSEALAKAQKWQAEGEEGKKGKKKRKKVEVTSENEGVSREALEHFQAKRVREGDPMAALVREEEQ